MLFAFKSVVKYLIIYGCVIIHEYSHCLVARKYGVGTENILLTVLGGVANIEKEIDNPHQELRMVIAGPLSNIIIGLIAFGGYLVTKSNIFNWIFIVNIFLSIFNLIPAYPMDGGRIFKVCMILLKGQEKGTKLAQYLALFFFALFIVGSIPLKSFNLSIIGILGIALTVYSLKIEKKDKNEIQLSVMKAYAKKIQNARNPLEIYDIAKEVYSDKDLTRNNICFIISTLVGSEYNSCGEKHCIIKNCNIPMLRLNALFNRANQYTVKEMHVLLEDIRKN
jgi:Zn-dependent protease